jgi:solute carrier family 35 protein F5
MQLLLGYIGLFNAVVLLPIAVKRAFFDNCSSTDEAKSGFYGDDYASLSSEDMVSSCEKITAIVMAYLIAKAFFDNVLSDYLWARAVVLTSATVATVGLGLTIPLAFLSDWLLGRAAVTTPESIVGAFSVLVGFLLVNCGEGSIESIESGDRSEDYDGIAGGHEVT